MAKSCFVFLLTSVLVTIGERCYASHILGAELHLEHRYSNCFTVTLTVYSDVINGAPGANEDFAHVNLFDNENDELLQILTLIKLDEFPLQSVSENCSIDLFEATKIVYQGSMYLEIGSEIKDYYLSWERCCRNYVLSNIPSDPPGAGGISTGISAVLDFSISELVKGNSTAVLSALTTDAACVGKKAIIDLSAVDFEGDSIVYSLITPKSSVDVQNAFPTNPNSKPYPDVTWRPGFNLEDLFGPGAEASIDQNGILNVEPRFAGVFAYSVKYDEYRNNIKLSSTTRDFTLLILSGCSPDVDELVTVDISLPDEGRMLENLDTVDFSLNESVTFRAVVKQPIMNPWFNSNASVVVSTDPPYLSVKVENIGTRFIESEEDSAIFQLSLEDCIFDQNSVINLTVIGHNNRCSGPESDTLKFAVRRPVNSSTDSQVTINNKLLQNDARIDTVNFTDGQFRLPVSIINSDLDSVVLETCIQPDSLMNFSFHLLDPTSKSIEGELLVHLNCTPRIFDETYQVRLPILVSEFNSCGLKMESEYVVDYTFINQNPEPVVLLENVQIVLNEKIHRLSLSQFATDPNGEDLTYEVLPHPLDSFVVVVGEELIVTLPTKDTIWNIPIVVTDESCNSVPLTLRIDFVSITSNDINPKVRNRLFPTPNEGSFVVKFTSDRSRKSSFLIYDRAGVLVKHLDVLHIQSGENRVTIDTSELNSGFYYIRLEDEPSLYFKYLIIK